MHKLAGAFALLVSFFVLGCGGSSEGGGILKGAANQADAPQSASQPSTGQSNPGQPNSQNNAAPAKVDVCALFSTADAQAVVAATKSGPANGATFKAEPVPALGNSLGSCKFVWSGTPTAVVQVVADPAEKLSIHRSQGKPIPGGPGDEAIDERGTYYVRVKNVMLSIGETSVTKEWHLEMYKLMAPKMK